jgi:hypothetical protein
VRDLPSPVLSCHLSSLCSAMLSCVLIPPRAFVLNPFCLCLHASHLSSSSTILGVCAGLCVVRARSAPGPRDDLESVGYLLVHMVTGGLPWSACSSQAALFAAKAACDTRSLCASLPGMCLRFTLLLLVLLLLRRWFRSCMVRASVFACVCCLSQCACVCDCSQRPSRSSCRHAGGCLWPPRMAYPTTIFSRCCRGWTPTTLLLFTGSRWGLQRRQRRRRSGREVVTPPRLLILPQLPRLQLRLPMRPLQHIDAVVLLLVLVQV